MVSRQETSRPLLTPGEVMQLPPTEELVLVSGTPPIRALKARYYEDRELRGRILAPPKQVARTNDSRLPVLSVIPNPAQKEWADPIEQPSLETSPPSLPSAGNAANGGLRREPELPGHEEERPEPSKAAQEFEPQDENPSLTQSRRAVQRRFIDTARQASLDLGDKMGM
jgi:type IV secretion system protein VirD4